MTYEEAYGIFSDAFDEKEEHSVNATLIPEGEEGEWLFYVAVNEGEESGGLANEQVGRQVRFIQAAKVYENGKIDFEEELDLRRYV